jgi:hypothetical protein
MATHRIIGASHLGADWWCEKKDLTFSAAIIKDGKCPYCGKPVKEGK